MQDITKAGHFTLGHRPVARMGFGAMQLAGPGVYGPPKDPHGALAVLRAVIEAGVNHIDTSDFYGPHITNQLIREALFPYPDNLVLVTKVGAKRGHDASWLPANSPAELVQQVHDNLDRLGLQQLEVVNMRLWGHHGPEEGEVEPFITPLAELQAQGLIKHLGLSNATAAQVAAARKITPIVCVQNMYNIANRQDDALIDTLAAQGIAYVPFFPLGGFTPLQSEGLNKVAAGLGASPQAVALAWLLARSPNILVIPGTSSLRHLAENIAAAALQLSPETLNELNNL